MRFDTRSECPLRPDRLSIRNAVRETRLLLQQEGHLPAQAATRYRTAAELLAAAPPDSNTP